MVSKVRAFSWDPCEAGEFSRPSDAPNSNRSANQSLTLTVPDAASMGSVLLEVAWETVRLREFPYRPSRFDCLYLWTDESIARRFNSKRADAELYEVEIVDCSRVFAANMDLISYFEESETLGSMFERARKYWRTERKDEHREILLEGSIRIAQTIL